MKNTHFRNVLHYIAGAFIAFLLSLTFQGSNPIPEAIVILIVTTTIGAFWEKGWNLYNKSAVDKFDILRTTLGGVIFMLYTLIF